MKVISFGAGVNSIAMVIMLFKRGEIYPVVFADTGVEHPETYCYIKHFEKEFMSKFGQKLIWLHPYITPEYYVPSNKNKTLEEYCLYKKLIPFVTTKRWCSYNYKIIPINRYMKNHNLNSKIIGFTIEERHRAKDNGEIYPFIEEKITRKRCLNIIKTEGLPRPRKSRCFFCPYQDIHAWKALYDEQPELFLRSMELEKSATSNRGFKTVLSPAGVSLEDIKYSFDNQINFPDWDFEELEPCMCKL